ncbi:MAG: helix-turn-helix domain-containing protein [Tannerella sp.]|jgi:transcriptional regulator with XRE-family HTH domain|nr:helix-turn-helix domain-containing protein [Tannerella sp.]
MENDKCQTEVHMGDNVRIIRLWRKLSQDELADLLGGKIQCQVSQLEKKKIIDKEILEDVAEALRIDVEFLETFSFEKLLGGKYFEQNNKDTEFSVVAEEYENNSVPFSEVKKLYDEIRKQDRHMVIMKYLLDTNNIDYKTVLE